VDPSLADADLERLLAQLLRAVNAAGVGSPRGSWPAGQEDTGAVSALPQVSVSEARALTELLEAKGIAQGQLAALLGLEKSTVSRLAAGLERKGWVRRGRDGENQRYVRLYLTPAGRAVAALVWQAWQSRQARIIASLSEEERAGLVAGLRGLLRGLTAEGLLGALMPEAPAPPEGGEAAPGDGPGPPGLATPPHPPPGS
jgi:DNA-binding MarR family transcriptional regulator